MDKPKKKKKKSCLKEALHKRVGIVLFYLCEVLKKAKFICGRKKMSGSSGRCGWGLTEKGHEENF